jgi:chloramphenicol 3-O phosphotransferase
MTTTVRGSAEEQTPRGRIRIPATIILINGPPSVGKTSFSIALQDALAQPFLLIESDRWLPRPPGEIWQPTFLESARTRIALGLYAAVASFADHGNDVLVDGLLPNDTVLRRACLVELGRHRLIIIGLTASASTLTAREKARGDRPVGTAVRQSKKAHDDVDYDLLLDTDNASPAALARQIQDRLRDLLSAHPPR